MDSFLDISISRNLHKIKANTVPVKNNVFFSLELTSHYNLKPHRELY